MPIYEYQCRVCGHQFDQLQKISDATLTDCPACGKPKLERLISPAGFQLKGTGWYVTDFKDSGKPKKEPEKKTTETKTEKAAEPTTKKTEG